MMVLAFIHVAPDPGGLLLPVVLYIGPDVFLPITSALAAMAGVLLVFWHRIAGFVGRLFGRGSGKSTPPDPPGGERRG